MTFEGMCNSREQSCMCADVSPGQLWFHRELLLLINDFLSQPDTSVREWPVSGARCLRLVIFQKKERKLEINM